MKFHSEPINYANADYQNLLNRPDSCHIYIAMTDWTAPYQIRTNPKNRQLFNPNSPYGILSSGTFHAFLPLRTPEGDDAANALPPDLYGKVKDICMKAADVLQVDVFGADMVLDGQGVCHLVNFDDWPSFAPIRKQAARAIAKAVMARARKSSSKRKSL